VGCRFESCWDRQQYQGLAEIRSPCFMSHCVADVPVLFQWVTICPGNSVRHDCDIGRGIYCALFHTGLTREGFRLGKCPRGPCRPSGCASIRRNKLTGAAAARWHGPKRKGAPRRSGVPMLIDLKRGRVYSPPPGTNRPLSQAGSSRAAFTCSRCA
jgi:hypothetical protein